MKIVVFSDTHNDIWTLQEIVSKHLSDTDLFIFLGDGEDEFFIVRDMYPHKKFEAVCGNCDYGSQLPQVGVVTVEGKKIYFTHGFVHQVKLGTEKLIKSARENNADIVFFGHTHNALTNYDDGLYIMNPGSLNNKGYSTASYGTISISEKDGVLMNIVTLD